MEYLLLILLLTFFMVSFFLIQQLAKVIGEAPFYILTGGVFLLGLIITGIEMRYVHSLPGLSIDIGPIVFMTPMMAVLLLIYLLQGTLHAQRFLWGMVFFVGISYYCFYQLEHLLLLVSIHVKDNLFQSTESLASFFRFLRPFSIASLLVILIEYLFLPMFYELINRFQVPLFLRITGAFLATQVLDAFFFELVVNPLHPFWFDHLRHVFLIRAISSLWIGILTTIYLQLCRKSEMEKKGQRSPFDLVIAFFGAYSKAQRLAAKLQEWEDRYRLVLDATHDLILIIDETGTILDKNRAANMFLGDLGSSSPLLYSQCFPEPPWETVWSQLYRLVGIQHWIPQRSNIQYDIEINPGTPSRKVLETNFIPFIIQKRPTILMVARDVTTRRKLEEDLKNQERQLLHAERMEAIGTLAGGIAHDFNNLLQAISGSLEQLDQEISTPSERTHRLIINIREASQRAAKLVNQLLGFARHGKYEEEQILLHELIEDVSNLFAPVLEKNYVFRKIIHPSPIIVMGDYTQLQQVILNLLFNARDATKDVLEPKITLRGEFAQETMKGWEKHPPGAQPEDYSVIRVRDNGCGIPPHILPRIFEPFFTTKGSTGTGMGLAMAYGIIENHHGWIHVESPVENQSGTEVYVFLPLASTSEKRKPKTVTELPSKK